MTYSTTQDIRSGANGYDYSSALRNLCEFIRTGYDQDGFELAEGCTGTLVEDGSEYEFNAQNSALYVVEFAMQDGGQRVGVYSDGAQTIIDTLEPTDTLENWANDFAANNSGDFDGVPYLLAPLASDYADEYAEWRAAQNG